MVDSVPRFNHYNGQNTRKIISFCIKNYRQAQNEVIWPQNSKFTFSFFILHKENKKRCALRIICQEPFKFSQTTNQKKICAKLIFFSFQMKSTCLTLTKFSSASEYDKFAANVPQVNCNEKQSAFAWIIGLLAFFQLFGSLLMLSYAILTRKERHRLKSTHKTVRGFVIAASDNNKNIL